MKALVGAFNQEKALVGVFSAIVQPVVEPMDSFTALLRMLVTPLRQMLVETLDVSRTKQLDILIKEVESAGPLSGNGYFDIGRGTLTSIVSISLTYFIILLQFRTG